MKNLSLVLGEDTGVGRDRNLGVIRMWMVRKAFSWDGNIKGVRLAVSETLVA